jgi:hypothetical protein
MNRQTDIMDSISLNDNISEESRAIIASAEINSLTGSDMSKKSQLATKNLEFTQKALDKAKDEHKIREAQLNEAGANGIAA